MAKHRVTEETEVEVVESYEEPIGYEEEGITEEPIPEEVEPEVIEVPEVIIPEVVEIKPVGEDKCPCINIEIVINRNGRNKICKDCGAKVR